MALATYQDLLDAVGNWLGRSDLTSRAPEFIALAEARIKRTQKWFVEIYSLANGVNFTYDATPKALPNYVRHVEAIWAATSLYHHPIKIVTPELWRERVAGNTDATGIPQIANVQLLTSDWLATNGPRLALWPRPADAFDIDLKYVRNLPAMSQSAVTALFVQHPDVYLFGALVESAPYLQHDERIEVWENRFQLALKEINMERERAELGASLKETRIPQAF